MTDTVFSYGSYTHDPNSVAVASMNRMMIRGETQRAHLMRVQWNLKGKLISATAGDIWSRVQTMMQAYAQDGTNLTATMSGTSLALNGQSSIGGVRVVNPVSFGEIMGAEGVTYLRFTVGLEADFLIATPTTVLSFSETLSMTDNVGGPIYVERIPAQGLPILQQVATNSWFFATQSGKASTSVTWPTPEGPIFSAAYLRTGGNAARTITYNSPKTIMGTPVEFTTQWKYEFISNTPLINFPNIVG